MDYYIPDFIRAQHPNNIYALDAAQWDVNGDKTADTVLLVGNKPFGQNSPFADNITLVVQDGKTKSYVNIPFKSNAGYNPTIFLGDFTGDGVSDILTAIDSGGSGGLAYYYIYSFQYNQPKLIFDYDGFNSAFQYEVQYKNNYKVDVVNKTMQKHYVIDISDKDKEYLGRLYEPNGKLKKPASGSVLPIGALYPVDFERDGMYELLAVQRVIGQYNADTLGFVQTDLKWDGTKFTTTNQNLAILGSPQRAGFAG